VGRASAPFAACVERVAGRARRFVERVRDEGFLACSRAAVDAAAFVAVASRGSSHSARSCARSASERTRRRLMGRIRSRIRVRSGARLRNAQTPAANDSFKKLAGRCRGAALNGVRGVSARDACTQRGGLRDFDMSSACDSSRRRTLERATSSDGAPTTRARCAELERAHARRFRGAASSKQPERRRRRGD